MRDQPVQLLKRSERGKHEAMSTAQKSPALAFLHTRNAECTAPQPSSAEAGCERALRTHCDGVETGGILIVYTAFSTKVRHAELAQVDGWASHVDLHCTDHRTSRCCYEIKSASCFRTATLWDIGTRSIMHSGGGGRSADHRMEDVNKCTPVSQPTITITRWTPLP